LDINDVKTPSSFRSLVAGATPKTSLMMSCTSATLHGLEITADTGSERPPAFPGVETAIKFPLAFTLDPGGTFAVNCVLVMKLVASGEPFIWTTEVETKFTPFTVSTAPGQAVAGATETLLTLGAVVGTARSHAPRPTVPARKVRDG
jgi:hypothetical protein